MNTLQRSYTPQYTNRIFRRTLLALVIALPLVFLLYLSFGAADASLIGAFGALFRGEFSDPDYKIIFLLRLPRALGAVALGAALATAGIIIQAVLNNPMAAPNLIGVNSGAGLAAVICLAVAPSFVRFLPAAAFIGAMLTSLLIFAIARAVGAGRVTVTLVGIAIGTILSAAINAVKIFYPDSVYDIVGFQIGSLSLVGYAKVIPACLLILPAIVLAILSSRKLDLLSLGEDVASGLGLRVTRVKLLMLTLASVLAGAAVSYAGLIGFVGLIAPHIFRRIVGGVHSRLIPVGALGGSLLVLAADLISKTLFAPYELPVGIILSLVGGPFFISLVLRARGEGKR